MLGIPTSPARSFGFRIPTHWMIGLAGMLGVAAILSLESRRAAMAIEPARASAVGSAKSSLGRLTSDVTFLADDAREGRGPGTEGIEQAAEYIARSFAEAGLKPAPGAENYFQPFTIKDTPTLGTAQTLVVGGEGGKSLTAAPRKDYVPLTTGRGVTLTDAPIVFAGYGITAKDPDRNLDYDDYAGLDVKGKIVIALRREPQQANEKSPFNGKEDSAYATAQHKATNAFQHGAAGLILVNDRYGLRGNPDLFLMPIPPTSNIALMLGSREFVDRVLAMAGSPTLDELEQSIDAELKPVSRNLANIHADLTLTLEQKTLALKNVVGVLEGSGPLADETIIIGAHYDHLGRGDAGSLAMGSTAIHNGADDNASGTALVMELARRLGSRRDPLPRRIVFMAFSGEERGLRGSLHYVEHPLIPLDKSTLMINFDMVGRLNRENSMQLIGTGTNPALGEMTRELAVSLGFNVKMITGMSDGFGGSDHQSFAAKKIPVLFAFTGLHSEYHRPSDDTGLINFDGMVQIANLFEQVLLNVANRPQRVEFVSTRQPAVAANPHAEAPAAQPANANAPAEAEAKAKAKAADPAAPQPKVGAMRGGGAYLGTQPDYAGEAKGVKLGGVTAGSPAEKAGLKGGDVIVRFDGKPIATIEDYMEGISRHKPGDVIEVGILRDGKELPLKIVAGSRGSK